MEQENDFFIEEVVSFTPQITRILHHLLLQLNKASQMMTDSQVKELLASGYAYLFFAKSKKDDSVVGMVTLILYRTPHKYKGVMEDVVVDKPSRRRGIGKKLLQHGIAYAQEKGVEVVDLTSNPLREEANRLYQQLGFIKRQTNIYRLTL